MTRNDLHWLEDPALHLRSLPTGTLIVARTSSDVINLAEIMDRDPGESVVKYRRFPDCRILGVEEMNVRGVKFALLA